MTDIWYYATYGEQKGPVAIDALRQMIAAGQLIPSDLVWKPGMTNWTQAGRMAELFGQPPPEPGEVSGRTKYGDEYSQGQVWRDGKTLIMLKGATLPRRCAVTNEPVDTMVKRKFSWHPPILVLLILIALLVYIIVALCMTKRATIMIGLSKQVLRRRRIAIAVGCLGSLAGLFLIIGGAARQSPLMVLVGLLVLIVALVYAYVRGRPVSPRKIDNDYLYLRGCCEEYLEAFPQLAGPAPPRR